MKCFLNIILYLKYCHEPDINKYIFKEVKCVLYYTTLSKGDFQFSSTNKF